MMSTRNWAWVSKKKINSIKPKITQIYCFVVIPFLFCDFMFKLTLRNKFSNLVSSPSFSTGGIHLQGFPANRASVGDHEELHGLPPKYFEDSAPVLVRNQTCGGDHDENASGNGENDCF